ncbi:hypothetical protein SUGI_0537490 [Cryptomeria japonica]|nr:hypothetical protein SUGI_0537490 [Cryptomeria japonica]
MSEERRLEGKVAIITGGAAGLGEATVRLFTKNGAKVIIADIADDAGHMLAQSLSQWATFIHCDVTKEQDVSAAVDLAMEKHGQLDIMFDNAGQKGKGRADRALEDQLIASTKSAKDVSDVTLTESTPTTDFVVCPGAASLKCDAGKDQLVVSTEVTKDAMETKLVDQSSVIVFAVGLDAANLKGIEGEATSTCGFLLVGYVRETHVVSASGEALRGGLTPTIGSISVSDPIFKPHARIGGVGFPFPPPPPPPLRTGREVPLVGIMGRLPATQIFDTAVEFEELKAVKFKDIHVSLAKEDNEKSMEMESGDEDDLSDDLLGMSVELGETDTRTIKQTKSKLNKATKGSMRGMKNRQKLLEEAGNVKGQTKLLISGRDLFSPR